MHLYKYKCFILLFIPLVLSIRNNKLKVFRKGLGDISPVSIGLQFFVEVNNTSTSDDFEVELRPDECCLVAKDHDVDCKSLAIVGVCHEVVPKGSTKSFTLIAPLLDPYQRQGYCNIFLDSSTDREKYIMRDKVSINFDTNVDENEDSDVVVCEQIDQDPLNNCEPVDCATFYNDQKTHFSRNKRRCVRVPICMPKTKKTYPATIYNPISNECTDNVITNRDINSIKTLNKLKRSRFPKDIVIITNHDDDDKDSLKYNDTFSNSIYEMPPDPMVDDSTKCKNMQAKCTKPLKEIKKKGKPTFIFKEISRLALVGLLIIILVQCCLIFSMVYCLIQKFRSWKQNKDIINTYYSYRHDASVTTPLIDTSNIDTNTNDQQYSSESSANIQNKTKHYKSIPKEESDNVKKSLSDDILSKCINRRNWIRNTEYFSAPNNSIHASNLQREELSGNNEKLESKPQTQYQTNFTMEGSKKASKTKLDFENESPSKADIINKTVSNLKKSLIKMTLENRLSSEKELKCTSYNNAHSKSSDILRQKLPKHVEYLHIDNYNLPSIEKSAQAYFSNDSIDEFISERGITFFAGDDMSKYTLSSDSIPVHKSSCTGTSNKTSKNNIVSNVLSLLRMRSKHGTNSDPGVKSAEKSLDVQFLHISTNSVYSSTNNEMEMLVNSRNLVSESRTSM